MKVLLFLVCALFVYTHADTTINFNFDGMIPPLPTCNCSSSAYCGDGVCSGGETNVTCPNDCNVHVPVCGDHSCDAPTETPFNCPADCSRCGDGVCDNTETLASCPIDCIACGDGFCSQPQENITNCPVDCSNICGNGVCEKGETFTNCPSDCKCVAACSGKKCGSDGCGGSCGTCPTGQTCNSNGACVCTPNCSGRNCGSDGCSSTCGTCPTGETCSNKGVCTCTPNCSGRNCGSDGCGSTCGSCPTGEACNSNGVCTCTPNCSGKTCGSDGCGSTCGTCPTGETCSNKGVCTCTPNCSGRNCGSDGCGSTCGTCPTGQSCNNNGVCITVCTPNCSGRNCGSDGCSSTCGTCPTGQVCSSGVCSLPVGERTVVFSLIQVNTGSAGIASGVTITGSLGTAVTDSTGSASLLVAQNDTVSFSGTGYQTVTVEIYGSDTEIAFLIPPSLSPTELFTGILWLDDDYSVDWHMFGPGNRTQYPTQEGVVNWAWVDKSEEAPYAHYYDYSNPNVAGCEIIRIAQLNYSAPYDFTMYLWSRVGGGDPTATWPKVQARIYIFGGSLTGIGSYTWSPLPVPTPPAGSEYVFYAPFTLQPSGTGKLNVIAKSNPYDPAVTDDTINNNSQVYYPCEYPTYCPYPLP